LHFKHKDLKGRFSAQARPTSKKDEQYKNHIQKPWGKKERKKNLTLHI